MPQAFDCTTGRSAFCVACDTMLPNDAVSAASTARHDPKNTVSLNEILLICGANRNYMPTAPSSAPNSTPRPAFTPKKMRELMMFIQTIDENAIAARADVI